MRPLYDARIEDLGDGDFLRVECAAWAMTRSLVERAELPSTMTSQFISSTPDDVEAISEKTENSWPMTSPPSLAPSTSPEATPIPSAAAARPYAIDLYVSAVTTSLPRRRASLTRSVVRAPVLIWTKCR